MAGNTLGERRYYAYMSDGGTAYRYLTDVDLATAIGATENDTNPDLPRRFNPRILYAQATINGDLVRKSIIVPTVDNTAYAAESPTDLTIDTETFRTTGRRGEKQSFGANPPTPTP